MVNNSKDQIKKASKKIIKRKTKKVEKSGDAVTSEGPFEDPEALVEGLENLDADHQDKTPSNDKIELDDEDLGELDEDAINAELKRLGVNDKELKRLKMSDKDLLKEDDNVEP